MTRRFLSAADNSTTADNNNNNNNDDKMAESIDSDFVVIMAALLCALICVLGLVAVARCAWPRRFSFNTAGGERPPSSYEQRAAANKGLKKKILRSLPILRYSPELAEKLTECPICLSDFATGDDVRVLPQCGHGFHVGCIDTWLGSHSSCPSCRQILVASSSRCQNCGGVNSRCTEREEVTSTSHHRDDNRFLA